jgi:hypothetical protein
LDVWWSGPLFLFENTDKWPQSKFDALGEDLPEVKTSTFVSVNSECVLNFDNFSSYLKLLRLTAIVLRFVHNLLNRKNPDSIRKGPYSVDEFDSALKLIVKETQRKSFHNEIEALKLHRQVNPKSDLKSLNPILDKDGLLCVGGRLDNSAVLNERQKHPWILSKDCCFLKLLIRYEHEKFYHAGVQLTLSVIRQKFWPVKAWNVLKQELFKCLKCFKMKPVTCSQLMGNLPKERVDPQRPFNVVGTDFCGPFYIKCKHARGRFQTHKVYVCLFVCFVLKAVRWKLSSI